jgi:hypothetical protein
MLRRHELHGVPTRGLASTPSPDEGENKRAMMNLIALGTREDSQPNLGEETAAIASSEAIEICKVIGPTELQKLSTCPCCNREYGLGRQVVGGTDVKPRCQNSLLTCCSSDSDDESSVHVDNVSGRRMPGVPSKRYVVKEVIAQGYVYKKGSGLDWLRSRAWKLRWAVLVVSRRSLGRNCKKKPPTKNEIARVLNPLTV